MPYLSSKEKQALDVKENWLTELINSALIDAKNLHHNPKFYYCFKENVLLNLMKNFFKKKRN